MRPVTRRAHMLRLATLVLLLAVLALVPAACGNDGTGPDSTVSTEGPAPTVATTGGQATVTTAAQTGTSGTATPETGSSGTTVSSVPETTASTGTNPNGSNGPTTTVPSQPTTTAKATTTTAKATTTTAAPTTTTAAAGPVVLKLSGPSGSMTFTMAQLKALPATSGYGGWKNRTGAITAPVSWKGVTLSSLMKLVGGGSYCSIVASDGYTSSVTPGASMGTYDPATGESLEGIKVTAILAYSKDGGAIGGDEGPLRIAFITPEKNQVTDGSDWARMVVEIKVK
jgi:hypothetical protein